MEVPPESGFLQMAAEIADGMAYLESNKIIHRFWVPLFIHRLPIFITFVSNILVKKNNNLSNDDL